MLTRTTPTRALAICITTHSLLFGIHTQRHRNGCFLDREVGKIGQIRYTGL